MLSHHRKARTYFRNCDIIIGLEGRESFPNKFVALVYRVENLHLIYFAVTFSLRGATVF
jgi:hypothetical protein